MYFSKIRTTIDMMLDTFFNPKNMVSHIVKTAICNDGVRPLRYCLISMTCENENEVVIRLKFTKKGQQLNELRAGDTDGGRSGVGV